MSGMSLPKKLFRTLRRTIGMGLVVAAAVPAGLAVAESPASTGSYDADPWLTVVNSYRSMSGLGGVVEDAALSAGSYNHSCYMLQNGVVHDEIPGLPGYTPEGDLAGNNGNVNGTGRLDASDRSLIELWMTAPFHAVGVLRPNLVKVGYGKCTSATTPVWRSAGTLDVLRGLGAAVKQSVPITFPGHGATIAMDRFVAETPNPMTYCGWTGAAGVPLVAMMPEAITAAPSSSLTGPNGPVETCTLSPLNTDGVAQAIMKGNNVVVVMPRTILVAGTYTATVTAGTRTATWSFTIDPTAAHRSITAGAVTPTPAPDATAPAAIPSATPPSPTPASTATGLSDRTGYQPLVPARVVDTRIGQGATRLRANDTTRIEIGGAGGVPIGATAVSANFTVTRSSAGGYLTVWNCSPGRPVVATLNFAAGETVPNAASVPLDSSGALCVYSPADADLVVDVNGYYSDGGSSRFTSLAPVRLMDTRVSLSGERVAADGTIGLQVAGVGGVPAAARAVVLNVASVDAARAGFVTVYPCDQPRPLAASLNPVPGAVKPNLVVAPLSADGRVCLYTLNAVHLVVDATGYLSRLSPLEFTSATPFRFTDTREPDRVDVNAGTGGGRVRGGSTINVQIAGERGVPADATAVSVNIAVTDADEAGFITAFPCGEQPDTATVNYATTAPVSTGAHLPLSDSGSLCLYVMSTAHVVVDINGWWS